MREEHGGELLDRGRSRRPSPSPTTRSPTSTCRAAARCRGAARRCERCRASSGCSTTPDKRASASTTRARAIWSRSRDARSLVHLLLLARRRRAPDFARTVDIHRKPGYDPVELFLDPALPLPKLAIGWRLRKRKLGFRTLMDVIPLEADAGAAARTAALRTVPKRDHSLSPAKRTC